MAGLSSWANDLPRNAEVMSSKMNTFRSMVLFDYRNGTLFDGVVFPSYFIIKDHVLL